MNGTVPRRVVLGATALAAIGAGVARADTPPRRPVALIYRGPAACDGCAEAAADLLRRQPQRFVIRYSGARLDAAALRGVQLYVQPGGGNDLDLAWRQLLRHPGFTPDLIPSFVHNGGRFLGLCMGGYLAGGTDTGSGGFRMLPGDSGGYVGSPGADVRTTSDVLVTLSVRNRRRTMYFQDGPYFWLDGSAAASRAHVLGRYRNNSIAMLTVPYGRGLVAASGPHPEATPDWYAASGLPSWYAADKDIGDSLISVLLR